MDFPIPPEFWWSTDNLSASIFLQGVDQKILPCGQGRIDSVKINLSLLMMREWCILVWGSNSCSGTHTEILSPVFEKRTNFLFPTLSVFDVVCMLLQEDLSILLFKSI